MKQFYTIRIRRRGRTETFYFTALARCPKGAIRLAKQWIGAESNKYKYEMEEKI